MSHCRHQHMQLKIQTRLVITRGFNSTINLVAGPTPAPDRQLKSTRMLDKHGQGFPGILTSPSFCTPRAGSAAPGPLTCQSRCAGAATRTHNRAWHTHSQQAPRRVPHWSCLVSSLRGYPRSHPTHIGLQAACPTHAALGLIRDLVCQEIRPTWLSQE